MSATNTDILNPVIYANRKDIRNPVIYADRKNILNPVFYCKRRNLNPVKCSIIFPDPALYGKCEIPHLHVN